MTGSIRKSFITVITLLLLINPFLLASAANGDDPASTDAARIDSAIDLTLSWYQDSYPDPDSWQAIPALWALEEDLNQEPWGVGQAWRLSLSLGDVNEDGVVDVSDAIKVLRHIVDLTQLDEFAYDRADVTREGRVGVEDAIGILRFVVGLNDGLHEEDTYKDILRLLSAKKNPAKVSGGINLFEKLIESQQEDGSFGHLGRHIWSVVSLEIGEALKLGMGEGDYNRESALSHLLKEQNADGSFGAFSQLDFTGWALIALSFFSDDVNVGGAIENSVDYLKDKQQDTAGFATGGDWGGENSNSNASVISGLVAIGEDVLDPEGEWVKNGNTVLDALLKYQQEDGSFWYMEDDEGTKKFSVIQCLMALSDLKYGKSVMQKMTEDIKIVSLSVQGITDTLLPASEVILHKTEGDLTVLNALMKGLNDAGINLDINVSEWGTMVTGIGNDNAGTFGGWDGWMYSVNEESPWVGAADYLLDSGDEILFYYGRSAAIESSTNIGLGEENPVVIIDLKGDEFVPESEAVENWDIDLGETGLQVGSIVKDEAQKATITFSGTASEGTLSIVPTEGAVVGKTEYTQQVIIEIQ